MTTEIPSTEHHAISETECACGYGATPEANKLAIPGYLRAKALRIHLAVETGTL